jgi:RNase P subunit RPR2
MKILKAIKAQRCAQCGAVIEPGGEYTMRVWVKRDAPMFQLLLCMDCARAS